MHRVCTENVLQTYLCVQLACWPGCREDFLASLLLALDVCFKLEQLYSVQRDEYIAVIFKYLVYADPKLFVVIVCIVVGCLVQIWCINET